MVLFFLLFLLPAAGLGFALGLFLPQRITWGILTVTEYLLQWTSTLPPMPDPASLAIYHWLNPLMYMDLAGWSIHPFLLQIYHTGAQTSWLSMFIQCQQILLTFMQVLMIVVFFLVIIAFLTLTAIDLVGSTVKLISSKPEADKGAWVGLWVWRLYGILLMSLVMPAVMKTIPSVESDAWERMAFVIGLWGVLGMLVYSSKCVRRLLVSDQKEGVTCEQ